MTLADLYDQHANECLGSAEFGTLLGSGLEGPLAAPLALEAWPNTSDFAAAGAAAVNGGCDPFEMPGFLDAKNRVPLTPEQEKRLAEVTAQSAEAKRTNPDADRVRPNSLPDQAQGARMDDPVRRLLLSGTRPRCGQRPAADDDRSQSDNRAA